MNRQSGSLRIFLYNWPIYAGTWGFASAALLFMLVKKPAFAVVWILAACAVPLFWSAVSLVVSHYIYDRSPLVSGAWLPALLATPVQTWATIHAGLDSEIILDKVMPGRCIARLDIFDARVMKSPSIGRARAVTPPNQVSTRCSPTALTLAEASCDAVLVAFTAHEIRITQARERFFKEIYRALRPGGRMVLVEHLRDAMNFVAFGPGFLHFVARHEWLRLAAQAHFVVACEMRVTPWVIVLVLERRA